MRGKDELTLGERAADIIRNGMGSWGFVFMTLAFLFGWMAWNRRTGPDPYPFILLNLGLSMIAALQGAILLIAAKRADQVSAEVARHDLEADMRTEDIVRMLAADFAKLSSEHRAQGQMLQNIHDHILGLPNTE